MTSRGPEPLVVQLNVQCGPPEWQLNESLFAHSMLYTAVFLIGDVPLSEENDLLAAFMGNEIRGVSSEMPFVQQTVTGTPRNPFVWQASTATDISDGHYWLPTEFANGQN